MMNNQTNIMLRLSCTFTPELVIGPNQSQITEAPGKLDFSFSRDIGGYTVVYLDSNTGNAPQKIDSVHMPLPTILRPVHDAELNVDRYIIHDDSCVYIRHFALENEQRPSSKGGGSILRTTLAGQTQFYLSDVKRAFENNPTATHINSVYDMEDTSTNIRKGRIYVTIARKEFLQPCSGETCFVFAGTDLPMKTGSQKSLYCEMAQNYHKLTRILLNVYAPLGVQATRVKIPPYMVNSLIHIPGLFALIGAKKSPISYWLHVMEIALKRQFYLFKEYDEILSYFVEIATDQEILDVACEMAFFFTSYMSYMSDYTMDPNQKRVIPCERFEVCLRRKSMHGLPVGCDCEDMAWSIHSVLWELSHLSDSELAEGGSIALRRIVSVLKRHEFLMTLKAVTSAAFKSGPCSSTNPLDDPQGGHMDITILPRRELDQYLHRFYRKHDIWLDDPKLRKPPKELLTSGISHYRINSESKLVSGNVVPTTTTMTTADSGKTRMKFGEGTEWVHPDGGDSGIAKMSTKKLAAIIGMSSTLIGTLEAVRATTTTAYRSAVARSAEQKLAVVKSYRHEHIIERAKEVFPFYRQAISFFWPKPFIEDHVPVLGGYFLTAVGNVDFKIGASIPELMQGPRKNSIAVVLDPPMSKEEVAKTIYALRFTPEVPAFAADLGKYKASTPWADESERLSEQYTKKITSANFQLKDFQKKFFARAGVSGSEEFYSTSTHGRSIIKGDFITFDVVVRFDEIRDELYSNLEADLERRFIAGFDFNWEIVHIDPFDRYPIGGCRLRLYIYKKTLLS